MEIDSLFINYKNGGNNYILKADSKNRWCGFNKKTIDDLKKRFAGNFNIVLWGTQSETDFYCIPFSALDHLFTEEHMTKGKIAEQGNERWTATITDHIFKMHANSMYAVNISKYYEKTEPISLSTYKDLDDTYGIDYTIEDAKANVKIRLGQSSFRNSVLANFNNKCCITNISESSMLVASHIVPWSKNKNYRSDPANGLCLFIEFDAYFDKGYITIEKNLKIKITTRLMELSNELQKRLKMIEGTALNMPLNYKIKEEYIEYHQENIFDKF